jgi:hypothetical protein
LKKIEIAREQPVAGGDGPGRPPTPLIEALAAGRFGGEGFGTSHEKGAGVEKGQGRDYGPALEAPQTAAG